MQNESFELDELRRKYKHLCKSVTEMMNAQKLYLRKKDYQSLLALKILEKKVIEIISPLQSTQAQLDYLAQ